MCRGGLTKRFLFGSIVAACALGCGSAAHPSDGGAHGDLASAADLLPANGDLGGAAQDLAPSHRSLPQISFGGGHVLDHMRLVVIVAPSDPNASDLFKFCDTLVTSQWWSAVTGEYKLGKPSGCVHLTGPVMASGSVDDAYMTSYIANSIAAAPVPPQPDGQTMYLLFLPPQTMFNACQYSGYHEAYGKLGDGWGVVERCQFDFSSVLESLTVVGSHEVVEAATDPDGKTGWGLPWPSPTAQPWQASVWNAYSPQPYLVEVGDFCISSHTMEGGVWFQRSFSNAAAATGGDPCVPALSVPDYNIDAPADWYAVAPGASVTVPLTGWSTAATQPWQFSMLRAEASTTPPPTTFTISAPTTTVNGVTYDTMSTGQTATVTIHMGAGAQSKTWRTWWIDSFRVDSAGNDGLNGDDHDHSTRIGVYVP